MFTQDNIIFAYTRREAIEDGVLWDISEQAKKFGFHCSVATTAAIYHKCELDDSYSEEERNKVTSHNIKMLMKTLQNSYSELIKDRDPNTIQLPYETFTSCILLRNLGDSDLTEKSIDIKIVFHVEPGGIPAITIMLPHED